METRALVIMFAVGVMLFTVGSGFIYGLLQVNGVAVPASAAFANNATYASVSHNLNASATEARANVTGALQAPSTNGGQLPTTNSNNPLGFLGNFAVFGGVIFSVFGYLAALPSALSTITTVIANPIQTGTDLGVLVSYVVIFFGGVAFTVMSVLLIFDIVSSVTKYRV